MIKLRLLKPLLNSLGLAFLLSFSVTAVSGSLVPAAPKLAASAFYLVDAYSGKVIASKNADQRLPPASLTKMMTSYIVAVEIGKGRVSLDDMVPISVAAWKKGGSKMYIREGTQVKLSDLLKGIIIQSGNDASIAVAEFIGGSEDGFAELMNYQAQELGMHDTHYMNATGWPAEDHYSTAKDLAILGAAIARDFPDHYKVYAEKYFTYNNIRQPNRNKLLWTDSTVDGLKTGHTEEAGYCLVASSVRKNMRLVSVVMGTKSEKSRAQESQKLLNYGFRFYKTHKLYDQGEEIHEGRVWGGVEDQLKLGLSEDLYVTIVRGEYENLKPSLELNHVIQAPVEKGQSLGFVRVMLDDKLVSQQPLVALDDVEEGGFIKRIMDSLKRFFSELFASIFSK
ncbi:MAG: D-alanyl-D-alanine carboxypeptidase [Pseudomonadales bacterium]|nr:D-alanyl-D-alanine carboxypeptidase [Pseudomonadales bacterium]